jgi:hypothetical protein
MQLITTPFDLAAGSKIACDAFDIEGPGYYKVRNCNVDGTPIPGEFEGVDCRRYCMVAMSQPRMSGEAPIVIKSDLEMRCDVDKDGKLSCSPVVSGSSPRRSTRRS